MQMYYIFLGFFTADGCVSVTQRTKKQVPIVRASIGQARAETMVKWSQVFTLPLR